MLETSISVGLCDGCVTFYAQTVRTHLYINDDICIKEWKGDMVEGGRQTVTNLGTLSCEMSLPFNPSPQSLGNPVEKEVGKV